MYVYLVQHGEAVSKEEDPERPLSEKGKEDVARVAAFVSSQMGGAFSIRHSGKTRARQTAEILRDRLLPGEEVSEADGLSPLDDPAIWAGRLAAGEGDIMLVGHLPHLERLASLLLCGKPEMGAVQFRMGGVVCLGRDDGLWSIRWMVIPDMA
ncbi:MAG: phosphohistidine phosphatase SixA [Thermodesulfovibrionales bacterium]